LIPLPGVLSGVLSLKSGSSCKIYLYLGTSKSPKSCTYLVILERIEAIKVAQIGGADLKPKRSPCLRILTWLWGQARRPVSKVPSSLLQYGTIQSRIHIPYQCLVFFPIPSNLCQLYYGFVTPTKLKYYTYLWIGNHPNLGS